ncbi:mitochondrial proton/calcium exchanger protein-like protein isoform X1 [Tanacetum coccineum]
MQEVVLFYNGLNVPTRQILDSRGAIPSKTAADDKVAIQEMAEYSQKWHNGTSRTRSIETSDGLAAIQAQLNNLGREIKKVNEKVYAAQVGCEQCKGGGYRATAPGFYQRNNANPSYQEQRQSMEDTLSKFMSELAKRHEENPNLIKEIRASTDVAIRNQGASIKTLEIQIGQISKVLQERGFGSLPSSTKTNPRDHVKSISTIVEADSYSIRHMGSSQYAEESYGPQFSKAYSYGDSHNSIPRNQKDPRSFTLPCFINNVCFNNAFADLGASVSVMPLLTYLNLGLDELAHTKLIVELADRTVKYPKGIAENVLVEARLMGETLVLNRSLDPFFEDYIELNDLNVPLELRRDQVDDLMRTIEEGEVIEEFRARNVELEWLKHHTNEQCNKIPALLKVIKEDMMKVLSYSLQKDSEFLQGGLDLDPNLFEMLKMEGRAHTAGTIRCMRWSKEDG